jgi:hypothetical protein
MEGSDAILYARENEQRLLRNMDVHVVVLDLLKIPYDKVKEEENPCGLIDLKISRGKIHE